MNQLQLKAQAELELRKRRAARLENFSTQRELYRADPLLWMSDRLNIQPEKIDWSLIPEFKNHKWDGTENPLKHTLDLLASGKRRIGIESGTGTGKTFLAACIVLWFLECYENSLVITSAPKQDQLTLHVWKEIGKLFKHFKRGELLSLELRIVPGSEEWIAIGFVAGVKADEESATKAQGFHARDMLIILEETPGIPQPIITAFENTAIAPHNIILAMGNPDNQFDNLHRFCTEKETAHIRISALDHPNIVLENADFIPGAQSTTGIKTLENKYTADGTMYLSRVRGISPKEAADSLIKMEWISKQIISTAAAQDIIQKELATGIPALGVDVANSEDGDDAAIAKGKGRVCTEVKTFKCPDANQLAKRDVIPLMQKEGIRPEFVGVDGVGVGAGTVNAMKEYGLKVQNLIGGAAPTFQLIGGNNKRFKDEQQYKNLRAQMYWRAREDIRTGVVFLPNDPELHADLVAPKWQIQEKLIIIESKEKIKSRLGRSPNKGDAFVYWNWVRQVQRVIKAGHKLF